MATVTAALYASEHGYDASFEALVAGIAAGILRDLDPVHHSFGQDLVAQTWELEL